MAAVFSFVEAGSDRRKVAVLRREGSGPEIVWLGGFRSEMTATKATHLDQFAAKSGRAMTRFDYSGHGQSSGRFEGGTISDWLEDALTVIDSVVKRPMILVGSSMGGWIALLAALRLGGTAQAPSGLLLIAPATDFTERLIWASMDEPSRAEVAAKGFWLRESAYGPPYPITRALIEDGRKHLLLEGTIEVGCPVHILQGAADPDVPLSHALALMERLPQDRVVLTTIRDGDHRLSRPEDLAVLERAVAAVVP